MQWTTQGCDENEILDDTGSIRLKKIVNMGMPKNEDRLSERGYKIISKGGMLLMNWNKGKK